jgi:hypothetical protein
VGVPQIANGDARQEIQIFLIIFIPQRAAFSSDEGHRKACISPANVMLAGCLHIVHLISSIAEISRPAGYLKLSIGFNCRQKERMKPKRESKKIQDKSV